MPSARSSTIRRCVIVVPVTREIRSKAVIRYQRIVSKMTEPKMGTNMRSTLIDSALCFRLRHKAYLPLPPENPCIPSPCGPYSDCHVVQEHPVCSCVAQYFGSPPNCRPECTVNSECPADKSCINQRCVDPCPGVCGINAMCRTVNHNPICSCMYNYVGDPFSRCVPQPSKCRRSCHVHASAPSSMFLFLLLQLNPFATNQLIRVRHHRAVRIRCVA